MITNALRRIMCAALAAALLCPAAFAENPSDNTSGYNPFTGVTTPEQTAAPASGNPFGGEDLTVPSGFGTGGATSAADLFGSNSTGTLTNDPIGTNTGAADPFGTGTAAASTDPFGTGTAAASTDPFGTGTAAANPAGTGTAAANTDPFGTGTAAANPAGTGTASTVTDPIGTNNASTAVDPFGTAATAAPTVDPLGGTAGAATNDPFGVGTSSTSPFGDNVQPMATATPVPMPTVAGYNPFADGGTGPQVPVNAIMYVNDAMLRVRARPTEKGKVIYTGYFGQQLNVAATQGEWAQLQTPSGATGYCKFAGLTYNDPNTMSKLMYAQLATTPVYRAPSLKTGRMRNLKKGDTVTMTAITGDGLWARVTADNTNYGFVPSIYLDDTPAAEGTPVWCAAGNTAVMVNPEGWIQISSLSFGQPAYLVGYVGNNAIAKIRSAKGYVAYCDASALTTVDPANMDTVVFVQATGKVLTSTTGEKAKFININKNVQLRLLGIDNSGFWALVRQGKRKMYIPTLFIGTQRQGNNARVVVVTQDATLYSSNQAGASVLGTLPVGTRLNLVGGDSSYAKVATISDGFTEATTGFVPMQYVKAEA